MLQNHGIPVVGGRMPSSTAFREPIKDDFIPSALPIQRDLSFVPSIRSVDDRSIPSSSSESTDGDDTDGMDEFDSPSQVSVRPSDRILHHQAKCFSIGQWEHQSNTKDSVNVRRSIDSMKGYIPSFSLAAAGPSTVLQVFGILGVSLLAVAAIAASVAVPMMINSQGHSSSTAGTTSLINSTSSRSFHGSVLLPLSSLATTVTTATTTSATTPTATSSWLSFKIIVYSIEIDFSIYNLHQ